MSINFNGKCSQNEHVAIALTQEEVIALQALIGELPGSPVDEEDERVDQAFEHVWQRLKGARKQFATDDEDFEAFAKGWVEHWINSKRTQA